MRRKPNFIMDPHYVGNGRWGKRSQWEEKPKSAVAKLALCNSGVVPDRGCNSFFFFGAKGRIKLWVGIKEALHKCPCAMVFDVHHHDFPGRPLARATTYLPPIVHKAILLDQIRSS